LCGVSVELAPTPITTGVLPAALLPICKLSCRRCRCDGRKRSKAPLVDACAVAVTPETLAAVICAASAAR